MSNGWMRKAEALSNNEKKVSKMVVSQRDSLAQKVIKILRDNYSRDQIKELERVWGVSVYDALYNLGLDRVRDIYFYMQYPTEDLPLLINNKNLQGARFSSELVKWRMSYVL